MREQARDAAADERDRAAEHERDGATAKRDQGLIDDEIATSGYVDPEG